MEMLSVKNDVNNRFADIDTMRDILNKNPSVDCQLVLKSSVLLMLYNTVEGVVSNILTELFDMIAKMDISITEFPNRLQNTVYSYHLKQIGGKPEKLKDFSRSSGKELCKISYLEISKSMKLFSGNLDSRKIREISNKMGVDLPNEIDIPELETVKKVRNKLAHGETRFLNACQDITVQELDVLCKKIKQYLHSVICAYERYCEGLQKNKVL